MRRKLFTSILLLLCLRKCHAQYHTYAPGNGIPLIHAQSGPYFEMVALDSLWVLQMEVLLSECRERAVNELNETSKIIESGLGSSEDEYTNATRAILISYHMGRYDALFDVMELIRGTLDDKRTNR